MSRRRCWCEPQTQHTGAAAVVGARSALRPRSGRVWGAAIAIAALLGVALPGAVTAEPRRALRDPSRSGFSREKALQLVRILRPRNTRTLARLRDFSALKPDVLAKRTGVRLRGLLLDVDETLAPHHGKIPRETIDAVGQLISRGLRVGIYSNSSGDVTPGRRADLETLRGLGAVVMEGEIAAKPARRGFEQATRALGLPAEAVAMVGDNYLTDGGAIRAGLHFIKVDPVPTDERSLDRSWGARLKRLQQRALRGYADTVARVHDRLRLPGHPKAIQLP